MQKKLLIITACMLAVLVAAGILVTIRQTDQKRQIEHILQGESEQDTALVSLATVREEAETLIQEGRNGAYRNLEFREIRPLITEEDRIYQIRVSGLEPEFPMTEEQVQKVYDTMQAFFEEPIDERKIKAIPSASGVDSVSLPELRVKIREQNEEYTGIDYVFLYLEDEEHEEQGQRSQIISAGIRSIMIDLGEPWAEEMPDRVYYPGAADGSLQDVYETADGEMSVDEAIEQTENYFNREFPVPGLGEMKYRVSRVFIVSMPDGTYGFELELRRSYGGVYFQGDIRRQSGTGEEVFDLTSASLNGEHHVTQFWAISCNEQVEKMQEITEIVSLKKATEYISQKIGDNTVYTVLEIELSYVGNGITEEDRWFEELSPAWMFITVNQTNGKEVRFYVDALTGEVSVIRMD